MSDYQIKVKVSGLPAFGLKDIDKTYRLNSDTTYKELAALVLEEQQALYIKDQFLKNFLIMSEGKVRDWDEKVCGNRIMFFLPVSGG